MQVQTKGEAISSLHEQMIMNEKHYQQALQKDEPFSVLKGFKNIIKELRSKLEVNLKAKVKS